MKSNLYIGVIVVLIGVLSAGCQNEDNPAMELQFTNRVFVVVDQDAMTEGVHGKRSARSWDDLSHLFSLVETHFNDSTDGPAIEVYSNVRYLPPGTAYLPTRVVVLYEQALKNNRAAGIILNPGLGADKISTMTREEIERAVPRIMQHKEPLRFEILVAGSNPS